MRWAKSLYKLPDSSYVTEGEVNGESHFRASLQEIFKIFLKLVLPTFIPPKYRNFTDNGYSLYFYHVRKSIDIYCFKNDT
jgi:hypothetical protein